MRLIDMLIDLRDKGPRPFTAEEDLMLLHLGRELAQAGSDAERWTILQREGLEDLFGFGLADDVLAHLDGLRRAALN